MRTNVPTQMLVLGKRQARSIFVNMTNYFKNSKLLGSLLVTFLSGAFGPWMEVPEKKNCMQSYVNIHTFLGRRLWYSSKSCQFQKVKNHTQWCFPTLTLITTEVLQKSNNPRARVITVQDWDTEKPCYQVSCVGMQLYVRP